jgi:hypothetical protein
VIIEPEFVDSNECKINYRIVYIPEHLDSSSFLLYLNRIEHIFVCHETSLKIQIERSDPELIIMHYIHQYNDLLKFSSTYGNCFVLGIYS